MKNRKTVCFLLIFSLIANIIHIPFTTQVNAAITTDFEVYFNNTLYSSNSDIHYTSDRISITIKVPNATDFYAIINHMDVNLTYDGGDVNIYSLYKPSGPVTISVVADNSITLLPKIFNFYKDTMANPNATFTYASYEVAVTSIADKPLRDAYGNDIIETLAYVNEQLDQDDINRLFAKYQLAFILTKTSIYRLSGWVRVRVFDNHSNPVGEYNCGGNIFGSLVPGSSAVYPERQLYDSSWGWGESTLDDFDTRRTWNALVPFTEEPEVTPTPAPQTVTLTLPINDTTYYVGQSASFTGDGQNNDTITGYINGIQQGSPQSGNNYSSPYKFTEKGSFTFKLIGHNNTTGKDIDSNTATVTVVDPPQAPTTGIDANPKSVNIDESYMVIDKCFGGNGSVITRWLVKEIFTPEGSNTLQELYYSPISSANSFFKAYSKSKPGYYTYYVYEIEDELGGKSSNQVSITVQVKKDVPPPTPTPTPTPTPKPSPAPWQLPVAVIESKDTVECGELVFVDGSKSRDLDGTVKKYYWYDPGNLISTSDDYSYINVQYDSPGDKYVYLTVEDNEGNRSDQAMKKITVVPPLPHAVIKANGFLKENRRVSLDASGSWAYEKYPVDHAKTTWQVTPVSEGLSSSDIKYNGSLTGMTKDILFKKPGTYRVALTVSNQYGSDTKTEDILIAVDQGPVTNFSTPATIYREPRNGNVAAINITDLSYSADSDSIQQRTWMYAYDSDNDGDYADEAWTTVSTANLTFISINVNQVGRYKLWLQAKEYINPAHTIPEFINDTDYRRGDTTTKVDCTVTVDNLPPVAAFGVTKRVNADIALNISEYPLDEAAIQGKINSLVLSKTAANNIDLHVQLIRKQNSIIENRIYTDNGYLDPLTGQYTQLVSGTPYEKPGDIRTMTYPRFIDTDGMVYCMYEKYRYNYKDQEWDEYQEKYVERINATKIESGWVKLNPNTMTTTPFTGNIKDYFVSKSYDTVSDFYSVLIDENNIMYVDETNGTVKRFDLRNNVVLTDIKIKNSRSTSFIGIKDNILYYLWSPSTTGNFTWNIAKKDLGRGLTFNANEGTRISYLNYNWAESQTLSNIMMAPDTSMVGRWYYSNMWGVTDVSTFTIAPGTLNEPLGIPDYGWNVLLNAFGAGNKIYYGYGLFESGNKIADIPVQPSVSYQVTTPDGRVYVTVSDNSGGRWSYYDSNAAGADAVVLNRQTWTVNNLTARYPQSTIGKLRRTYGVPEVSFDAITSDTGYRTGAIKFLGHLSNKMSDSLNNNTDRQNLLNFLSSHNAGFVSIGNGSNQTQMQNLIASNGGKGTHIDNTNIDTALDQLADYIVQQCSPYKVVGQNILLDDVLTFGNLSYSDMENDPKQAGSDRWVARHTNLTYYDNNLGWLPNSGGYTLSPTTPFMRTGQIEVAYTLRDNPKNDDRFDNFRKWSNENLTKMLFNVGRRPIADFIFTSWKDGSQCYPTFQDYSYDLDHNISRADKGIQAVKWQWREQGALTWNNGVPAVVPIGKIYEIKLEAQDIEGYWSDPVIKLLDATKSPPVVDAAPYTYGWTNLGIDVNIVGSDPDGDYRETRYLWADSTARPVFSLNAVASNNFWVQQSQQGIWYLHMEAWDIYGYNYYRYRGPYMIDTTPPVNGIDAGAGVVFDQMSVAVAVTDTGGSGLRRLEYAWSTASSLPSNWTNVDISAVSGVNNYSLPMVYTAEGTWYLHIRSYDIAGNSTYNYYGSYEIMKLKLENLRVTKIADPRWKDYFELEYGQVTPLQNTGIRTPDMPVYRNQEHNGIKLGYMTYFEIDSTGLNNPGDTLDISVEFFALDNRNNLYDADIYVEDIHGDYRRIDQIEEYNRSAKAITLTEANRFISEVDPAQVRMNTWRFEYFLPATAKAVRRGAGLDLVDNNTFDYKLLVVFRVLGRRSSGQVYDYTLKEANWGNEDGSEYGRNRPTGLDLLQKGANHGEVFWYNLYENALDDLMVQRKW